MVDFLADFPDDSKPIFDSKSSGWHSGFQVLLRNASTEVGASSTSKLGRSWFRRAGGRHGDPDGGDPRHVPTLTTPAAIGKNGKRSDEVSGKSATTEKAHVHLPFSPMPGTSDGLLSADD